MKRAITGWATLVLGLIMLGIGLRYHSTLWVGYHTETVVKEVVRIVPQSPTQDAPTVVPSEQLNKGQLSTGPLKIQETYELTKGNLPSGDLQVLDANNKIWMLSLCSPENNGINPKFKEGSWVNIVYTKEETCYRFLNATLLKEGNR